MLNHIIDEIKPLFPVSAEFKTDHRRPNEVGISWRLHDDPERPNKYSKTIRLQISDEFAEDYRDGNDRIKQSMMAGVPAFISAKLRDFDPTHNAGRSEINPEVTWVIAS